MSLTFKYTLFTYQRNRHISQTVERCSCVCVWGALAPRCSLSREINRCPFGLRPRIDHLLTKLEYCLPSLQNQTTPPKTHKSGDPAVWVFDLKLTISFILNNLNSTLSKP